MGAGVAPLRRRGIVVCGIALGLSMFASGTTSGAQTPTEEVVRIVDGVTGYLEGIRDMSADFVQVVEFGLNQTRREKGHVYLDQSGKARWEYLDPETRFWVMDGNTVRDYIPGENLFRVATVDPAYFDRLPLMSLFGRRNLDREFEFRLLERETAGARLEGTRILRVIPERETDIRDILIEVDAVSFELRRLFIEAGDGSTNDLVFENVLTNTGLSDSLWKLVPPEGTEIIE
jgi:outer membrane lipoprotein-sorting protein